VSAHSWGIVGIVRAGIIAFAAAFAHWVMNAFDLDSDSAAGPP
jgi:hypothetical protein